MNDRCSFLGQTLSLSESHTAQTWWDGLSDSERAELTELCDPRFDLTFFAPPRDGDGPAPKVIGGKFVPSDNAAGWGEMREELLAHLVNNFELVGWSPINEKVGGVCTAHRTVRAALEAGLIPSDFECPFEAGDCPMRKLLSVGGGKSLRLSVLDSHGETFGGS